MRITITVLLLLIVVLIGILFTGCSSDFDEIDKLNTRILELEGEKSDLTLQIEELEKLNENNNKIILQYEDEIKDINNKSDSTTNFKFEDSFVSDFNITTDGKYAIFILYDSSEYTGVYIYERDRFKLTKLEGVHAFSSFWSPDNEHFIVCDYSYLNADCLLYSVETKEEILSFSTNEGTIIWLNSDEIVYASENREIPLDSESDQYGTVDIIKHNLFTGEIVKLQEGTSQYYYSFQDINGEIKCYKRYVGSEVKDLEDEIIDIFD